MVGIAGSGKTTYARGALPDHTHMSMDIYRDDTSWPAKRRSLIGRYDRERPIGSTPISSNTKKAECVLVDDALAAGRSVVVDDTNLTREIRRPYVLLARKHGAAIRAVFFSNTRVARHRNSKRVGKDRVPEDAVTGQLAKMERPAKEEGLDSVLVMG